MVKLYLRDVDLYNTKSLLELDAHRKINPNLEVIVIDNNGNPCIGRLEKVVHTYKSGETWRDLIVCPYTNKGYLFDSEIIVLGIMVWVGDN